MVDFDESTVGDGVADREAEHDEHGVLRFQVEIFVG